MSQEERVIPLPPESGRGTISFENEEATAVEVDYHLVVSERLARFEPEDSWKSLGISAKGWVTPVRTQDQRILSQMYVSDANQLLRLEDGRSTEVKVLGGPQGDLRFNSRIEISAEGEGSFFSKYRSDSDAS